LAPITALEFLSVFHHVPTGSWGYSGILIDCMYIGKTITVNDRALDCRTKGAQRLHPPIIYGVLEHTLV
jgi:hypothetical protein